MAAIALPLPLPINTDPSSDNGHSPALSNGNGNGNSPTTAGDTKTAYSDPEADVALKASEGREFKVESYVLKAHSAYFRNLLKSSTSPTPAGFEAIPIEASTKLLKLFLDIMHMKPVPSSFVWAYRDRLLKLCDEYQLNGVAERAVVSLHDVLNASSHHHYTNSNSNSFSHPNGNGNGHGSGGTGHNGNGNGKLKSTLGLYSASPVSVPTSP